MLIKPEAQPALHVLHLFIDNTESFALDAPNGEDGSAIHASRAGNAAHEAQHRMCSG